MYQKGDIFLDKYTRKMYIFSGKEWFEVIPSSKLRKISYES